MKRGENRTEALMVERRANGDTKLRHHQDLVAWQEAVGLVTIIYQLTKAFPREEVFGLTSQTRKAAISIPSNIAEGAARGSTRELRQFLTIARGSLSELETQLLVARNLGYVSDVANVEQSIGRLFKLIAALLKSLGAK